MHKPQKSIAFWMTKKYVIKRHHEYAQFEAEKLKVHETRFQFGGQKKSSLRYTEIWRSGFILKKLYTKST